MTQGVTLLWMWVFLLWGGCAKHVPESAPAAYGGYYGEAGGGAESTGSYDAPMAPAADYAPSRGAPAKSKKEDDYDGIAMGAPPPPPPPPPAQPSTTTPAPAPTPTEPATEKPAAAARMVHYDGWASIRVADPRQTMEEVVDIAEGMGGRTETMAGNIVTVRIPVARFDEAWKKLLELGEVINRSVSADDVTDQFTATDLRAKTLRETQSRLTELIGKAKDEKERLALIQELGKVTEELDALESQLRTLTDLAGFSRITIETVARQAFTSTGGRPPLSGFEWIQALTPFQHSVFRDDHRIELPAPEGLVTLAPRGPFVAESADGTMLWTERVPNDPVGTAVFWAGAIQDRLADQFANPQHTRLGAWECLSVDQPAAEEPYHWQICVEPVGRYLQVVQAYYPSPGQLSRYGATVDAAISGEGGGS